MDKFITPSKSNLIKDDKIYITNNLGKYFSREAVFSSNKKYEPINVTKYNNSFNYYKINSLIKLLDTKEQLLKIDNFLSKQIHFNYKMYLILIDWILEITRKFKCQNEIIFLTVSILNQYINKVNNIKKDEIQCVGVTSFWIACKREGDDSADLYDLAYICADAYTKKQILNMEENILFVLDYDINIPTVYNFISLYTVGIDYKIVNVLPSLLASSCIRKFINEWTEDLIELTKYKEEDLISFN